jgi:hypothetical protein
MEQAHADVRGKDQKEASFGAAVELLAVAPRLELA